MTPVDAMDDACKAIQWVRANVGPLDIFADRIVAYGWSAGAHLAVSTAIFSDMSPEDEIDWQNDLSCVPDALILKSPALDLVDDKWFNRLLGDANNARGFFSRRACPVRPSADFDFAWSCGYGHAT